MHGAGPREILQALARNVGRRDPALRRASKLLRALANLPTFAAVSRGHCELGQFLAKSLGVSAEVVRGMGQVFAHWDGAGTPRRLKGEAIDRAVRVAQIATDAEAAQRALGAEAAVALVRQRGGSGYDPALAARFCERAETLFAALEVPSVHEAVLAAEPGTPERLDGERLERAIRAMGEFADMKSRYTRGHSAGWRRWRARRASGCGWSTRRRWRARPTCTTSAAAASPSASGTRRGADRGGVGARAHAQLLHRAGAGAAGGLGEVSAIAALAHERLDGGGYHRCLPTAAVPAAARVLAAADAYHAMTEPRPHRPALGPERAAEELGKEARAGRLDRDAVDAVLAAAGQPVEARRSARRPGCRSARWRCWACWRAGSPTRRSPPRWPSRPRRRATTSSTSSRRPASPPARPPPCSPCRTTC
jgi:hypothetical protein